MKKRFWIALLVALTLAFSITPAFAQGPGGGRSRSSCIGGDTTYEPGSNAQDFSLVGCNGTIKNGATVPGNVSVFGGNLNIEEGATVDGDVAVVGGATEISGHVRGNIAMTGGAVHLTSTAVVDGDVRVLGGSLNRAPGARIGGNVSRENNFNFGPSFGRTFVTPFAPFNGFTAVGFPDLGFIRTLITALALAALGALLVVFFPEPTRRVMTTAQVALAPSFGVGCLTMILLPVLLVLFTVIIIGIPVTLVLILAAVAASILGWIAIGYLAGERILQALKVRDITPILAVFVGVILLGVLTAVPCVGWLAWPFIMAVGVGAVVLTRFGTRPYPYTPGMAPAGYFPTMPTGSAPMPGSPYPLSPAPGQPGGAAATPPYSTPPQGGNVAPGSEGKVVPGSDEPTSPLGH